MLFRTRDVESFLKLFTFSKKRNLERYSRDTVVYGSDFAAIITASDAGRLPFHHGIYRSDIVPPHLVPTKASVGALSRNAMNGVGPLDREGRKAIGKLLTLFDQRRCLVGHLFFTPGLHEWHFFYCDQRDTAEDGNHWKGGPHIHLVNWLWPTLDPRSVWRDFVSTNKPPPQALHLRYHPDDLSDSAPCGRRGHSVRCGGGDSVRTDGHGSRQRATAL